MYRSLRGASLALVCLPLSSVTAQVVNDHKDSELQPLAASMADYLEARRSALDLDTARTALASHLAQLRAGPLGAHALKQAHALRRSLWLSHAYDKQKLRKGKVTEDVLREGSFASTGLGYAYRLPKKYDATQGGYPLILAIGDEEERPADHIREHWSSSEIRDSAIVICPQMPADRTDWDQVMVNGRPGGLCYVLSVLRVAEERFALDFERIFVAGQGKSVAAAVAAGNYSPQAFAGVLGRSGDTGGMGPDNFSLLPTYFSGAGQEAKAFKAAARGAGHDNCTLNPGGGEADAWSWMQDQRRATHPSQVRLVVGQPFPTRVYWLRAAPIAADAWVTGQIERESNTIQIESHGVSHVTLYLNDGLLDLDREVHVRLNGNEQARSISRSLRRTLDAVQDGLSDPACVYVAQVRFDMREDAAPVSVSSVPLADSQYDARLAKAVGQVETLWALHQWCRDNGRPFRSQAVLRKLLRLDPEHAAARAALGHQAAGGQWFESAASLERFQRSQDETLAEARGYVHHNGLWMHPDDRALASKGRIKHQESGLWNSSADRKRLTEGWSRQDLDWISPDEVARMDQGLWWVDGEWLELEAAHERHMRLDSMWHIPGPDVLLHSTVGRSTSLEAMGHMSRAIEDLRRVFGAEPQLPLQVSLLKDEEQYDRFAFGDPDGRRLATHAGRLQVIHSAYFAESWFPSVDGKRGFAGMGVCYWDAEVPGGNRYGVHAARLALGLSYVDALDPSPKAVRGALSKGPSDDYYRAYQAEKKLPAWLRYGGAVYAERYFEDTTAAQGADRWWARKWSLDNLRQRGGLRDLEQVFAFELNPEQRDDGLKLLLEAGLLVFFMVDGGNSELQAAHAKFSAALAARRLRPSHLKSLREAFLTHESELRAFAAR